MSEPPEKRVPASGEARVIPLAPYLERAREQERLFRQAVRRNFRPRNLWLVGLALVTALFYVLLGWRFFFPGERERVAVEQAAELILSAPPTVSRDFRPPVLLAPGEAPQEVAAEPPAGEPGTGGAAGLPSGGAGTEPGSGAPR